MTHSLTIPALLATVAIGGCRAGSPPVGDQQPPAPQPTAPFAEVVAIEPVQLSVPMGFRRAGRTVEARDVVIVYLRVANVDRFLPKGIETPPVLLEDTQAIPLYPPLRAIWAVVAPRPSIQVREATLWVAPIGSGVTEKDPRTLVTLRRASERKKPSDIVPLATVPAAVVRSVPSVVRDRAALLVHALARADSLAPQAR